MNEQIEQAVFSDLADLEAALAADTSGERARAAIAYFRDVALETKGQLQSRTDGAERQLASQLAQAFEAAQRIVQKVWEAQHGASLPL